LVALASACPRSQRGDAPIDAGPSAREVATDAATTSAVDVKKDAAPAAPQPVSIAVIPRAAWGAKPALTERMRANTPIRHVTIHHTADKNRVGARTDDVLSRIQSFHVGSKKWGDVAYHYFIDPAGAIYEGRDPGYAADTATEYDPRGHVTVCVLGNFEVETPTPAATASLARVVAALLEKHGLGVDDVRTHKQVAATACPGKTLQAWWMSKGAGDARTLVASSTLALVGDAGDR
jgi:hypothetical protein